MSRADVAEWILSLTTSRDHAASIAGDLAQQAPEYGARWFWASMIRAAASLTWRGFTDAPLRMSGLAALGLILQFFYALLIVTPIAVAHIVIVLALQQPRGAAGFDVYENPVWEAAIAFMIASFFLGKWIARRAPQRELVVYAVIWFIGHIIWIPMNVVFTGGVQVLPTLFELTMDAVGTAAGFLFVLAGIKRMRRKMAAA
jgi:hypothetical protein